MTDPVPSGVQDAPSAKTPAPAAPAGATDAPANTSTAQPTGAFGTTRGSGLLRGKRPTARTSASVSPKSGDYQPTSVEVIVAQREYKNPFGGAVSAPAADGSQEEAMPTPAANPPDQKPPQMDVPPKPPSAAAPPATPVAPSAPPVERVVAEPAPKPEMPAQDAKSQLNILPPAETKRTQLHWDKSHAVERDSTREFAPSPRRDDRRDERRDERRDDRPSFRSEVQRPRDDFRPSQPAAEPVEKPLGFLGRLKRLLGLGKPAPSASPAPQRDFEPGRGDRDQDFRRRRRGGRGNQGGERSERGGMPQSQQGGGQPFERRGGDQGGGGQHRRRHRGGRGRNQGGPRPEGQQGGGYI